MNNPMPEQGRRIFLLVRGLAVMGLAAVFVTLAVIGWTLYVARGEIAAAVAQQHQLNQTSDHLRDLAVASRTAMLGGLDDTMSSRQNQRSVNELAKFIQSQFLSGGGAGKVLTQSSATFLQRLSNHVNKVVDLSNRIAKWHDDYAVVWADLHRQVTISNVRDQVSSLEGQVDALAGQRRLQDSIRLRRWRHAPPDKAAEVAQSILKQKDAQRNLGDLSDFRGQLSELARLAERLSGEERYDALADLKDNQLAPVLERLSSDARQLGGDSVAAAILTPQAVTQVKQSLLGADGQGGGGLFALRSSALQLRRQRETLETEMTDLFTQIQGDNTSFAQATQVRTVALTHDMEESLSATWQRMLIFGGGCSIVFLWLSKLVGRSVTAQVDLLEEARASAEEGRRTTQQLMVQQQAAAAELDRVNKQLIETSRQAGMAEVATGVLHNVGNVLNSVNVSAGVLGEKVATGSIGNLARATAMLDSHRDDLPQFLTSDQKGRLLPAYLAKLSQVLCDENTAIVKELCNLTHGIEHIKQVVQLQQDYAKSSTFRQQVDPATLIDEALRINAMSLEKHGVDIKQECEPIGAVSIDKHKTLTVLINLISNAKNAVKSLEGDGPRSITIRLSRVRLEAGEVVRFEVADTGIGIAAENLDRIFSHGFTTRAKGHGFGLHSSANAAKEMNGSVSARSDGVGKGACFTLDVPLLSGASEDAKLNPDVHASPSPQGVGT